MKITIVGLGYVGMSNSVLLGQKYDVKAIDISNEKIQLVNNKKSPIKDIEIENYLATGLSKVTATNDKRIAYELANYIIICTPTDYDAELNYFNTTSIEDVIDDVRVINKEATIIIKSTVPVGYTESLALQKNDDNIIFSPEFLREGKSLIDNLYPSRIIVGSKSKKAQEFAELLLSCAKKENVDILLTNSTEAEAIKLFANSYLATRVSFFNELDSYCLMNNLETKDIINGVSLDPRIGTTYNNPSFGYGGYCLPKDTMQLKANFKNVPNALVTSIIDSNVIRKELIANELLKQNKKCYGFYRLAMKSESDNYRLSALEDIIKIISDNGKKCLIFEPMITKKGLNDFNGVPVTDKLELFKNTADIIVCNRIDANIEECAEKLFTRDIFNDN